ncbi:hypothetical protein X798_03334, partial [Onchocerca flexuosa]
NVKNILAVTDQHKQLWQGSITKSRDGQRSRDELIVLGVLEDTNIQRPNYYEFEEKQNCGNQKSIRNKVMQ